jgi:DNA-binding IclR family transcriptional regulator
MTIPATIETELEQVRSRGYAVNDEEYTVGIVGAAVPILDAKGATVAALAVHGPSPRLSISRARSYLPQLRAAASRLSRVWGLEAQSFPTRKASTA